MSSKAMQVNDASPSYVTKSEAQDVPEGYKRTEVGLIPEGWEVHSLGDEIDRLEAGVSVTSVDEEQQVCVHEHAVLKTSAVVDGQFLPSESKRIAPKDIRRAKLNPRRDAIIVSRMNTPELVGECGYVDKDYPDLYLPDRLWMARFRAGRRTSARWLSYLLSQSTYKRRLNAAATGTSGSMKNISKGAFFRISIPFPGPAEQHAIAEALSDVDGLLGALEALIAKKRAIKQAAMQQLLTGKTRLPGFSGEWETKRLRELLKFQVGCPFSSKYFSSEESGLRLVKNRDLKADDEVVFYVGPFTDDYLVKDGDVMIGMDGDFLPCLWNKGEALLNQRVGRIRASKDLDIKFAYYFLRDPLKEIERATSGTTVKHLSHGDVESIVGSIPDVNEQAAIATVLSDVDAEIAALEARREKTRALKQGMMQQLLTGRVRLVTYKKTETAA